jgi:hypothetical protein
VRLLHITCAAAAVVAAAAVAAAAPSDAQPEDAALQHQRAKEMLQLTEWMAAVGQGHKDMLVCFFCVTFLYICVLCVQDALAAF